MILWRDNGEVRKKSEGQRCAGEVNDGGEEARAREKNAQPLANAR
jgi:hypothetical protein